MGIQNQIQDLRPPRMSPVRRPAGTADKKDQVPRLHGCKGTAPGDWQGFFKLTWEVENIWTGLLIPDILYYNYNNKGKKYARLNDKKRSKRINRQNA